MVNIERKYVLSKIAKYKVPCLITLSGLPGSGKTVCAKVLSKNLKVFIVSNDFIRKKISTNNINYKIRDKQVLLLNVSRLFDLFSNRVSVILDSDSNDVDKFKKIELLTKIFKYKLIKIKINSVSDYVNLCRINSRKDEDATNIDNGIIGDNTTSDYFSEEKYYQIKLQKPQLLEDDFFDYVLDNDGDLQQYIDSINEISKDIISKRLILK